VRLQAVHHALGRHCEAIGDLKAAATHYIASGAAATEVTRMLWESGDMPELEQHVAASDDPGLLTWWARTCEAQGQYAQAISCYQRAGERRVHAY
jgi:tetratricopeptide (TPR) repeat protein